MPFRLTAVCLAAALLATGCVKVENPPALPPAAPAPAAGGAHADEHAGEASHASAGHDHSGWWCAEHGVPEGVCGQCSSKLAAGYQKKGDWCAEHDRPDSQCFKCHPELEAQFAAKYEAKYGKPPPQPEG